MLQSLQACRATAAILVVLYHTSHGIFRLPKYFGHKPFGPIFDFGFAGVDFFFVLSGFLMIWVHAKDIGQPRAFGAYLWKRFSRIYPAYWVVLIAIIPVYFLVPSFGIGHERDVDVIVRAIFLYPHPEMHVVLGVSWTLVYEVFFYVIFGLLILNRPLGIVVMLGWTVGLQTYPFADSLSVFVFNSLNLRFLAGLVVGLVMQRWQVPWPRFTALIGVGVFLVTGMAEALAGPLDSWQQCVGFTMGSSLTLAGLVEAERFGLLRPPRFLTYLGDASYSIYLVHFLALSVIAKLTVASGLYLLVPDALLFCAFVVVAIGAGCVFHHLIERPIHIWAKGRFRRGRTQPVVVPVSEMRQAA
jgi:peptidoglycan/LPS O-acetylase OafA/YrhL